jgi:hypothetical protein
VIGSAAETAGFRVPAATRYRHFDPLLDDGDAMLRLAERVGSYGTAGVEAIGDDGCFRETWAREAPLVDGIEPLLHHAGFAEAAGELFGRPLVRPSLVYAELLLPGQELAVHTDVPEFRGLSRESDPDWLLMAMHHSGLFEPWRVHVATGVAFFGRCRGGGEFCFYPDGPYGPPVAIASGHNTAIVLDTDSVLHGIDRVAGPEPPPPALPPDARLRFDGDGRWSIAAGDERLAGYAWDDLCFSLTWKARCYADAVEQSVVADRVDDLERDAVLDQLADDLRRRRRLTSARPSDAELERLATAEYVRVPEGA